MQTNIGLLSDQDLVEALSFGEISVERLLEDQVTYENFKPSLEDLDNKRCAVQPASIDFTIGRIYAPEDDDSVVVPARAGLDLLPGHTVIVETRERVTLTRSIGAFGFPPAGVSINSILMTNPGHVDPGYFGHLRFTLINMGRRPYILSQGERIASMLFFRMPRPALKDYAERRGGKIEPPVINSVLQRLSPDFASYGARMESAAAKAVEEAKSDFENKIASAETKFAGRQLWIPASLALLGTLVGYAITSRGYVSETQFFQLKAEVEAQGSLESIESRLEMIEESLPND